MDAQQQLFGFMAMAEEHRQAILTVLAELKAERTALANERAALARSVAHIDGMTDDIHQTSAKALPALQSAARQAVSDAVQQSLSQTSEMATQALNDASQPLVSRLNDMTEHADRAQTRFSQALAGFGWQWMAMVSLLASGLLAVLLVAVYGLTEWERLQISQLSDERQALTADVAQLQARVDELEKKGGRIIIRRCGKRLCIVASPNQGRGFEHWKGTPWINDDGVLFVIPKGY